MRFCLEKMADEKEVVVAVVVQNGEGGEVDGCRRAKGAA